MSSIKNITNAVATTAFSGQKAAGKDSAVKGATKATHHAKPEALGTGQKHTDHPVQSMMDDGTWFDDGSMDDEIESVQPEKDHKVKDAHEEGGSLSPAPQVTTVAKPAQKKKAKKAKGRAIPRNPVYLAHEDAVEATRMGFDEVNNTPYPYDHGYEPTQHGAWFSESTYDVDPTVAHDPELSMAERLLKVEKRILHGELVVLSVSGNEEAFAARLAHRRERFGSERLL